jgi:sugar-specific transcriptional regulator TrmB
MLIEISSKFGLTENQEKILSLIVSEGIVDTTIITKGTGISRPNAYDVLNKLIEKGLISRFSQNKKTLYKANKIDLNNIITEKSQELENLKKDVTLFNKKISEGKSEKYYDVEVFSGKKGFSNFIFSILDSRILYVFGAEGIFERSFPHIFMRWINQVKENRIRVYAVYNEKFREIREKDRYESIIPRYTKRRLNSRTTTIITKNSISLIHWHDNPLIINIKDKNVAIDYKSEFLNLWKLAEE